MCDSPSRENHKNRLQDSMSKALDSVMANEEQSYDNFISSFTFLKKQDVLPEMHVSAATQLSDKTTGKGQKTLESQMSRRQNHITKEDSQEIKLTPHSPEELETEILADGETTSRLSKAKVIRTGTAVQVDNFVETDTEEENTENIYTEGYTASFSTGSKSSPTNQIPDTPSCDTSSMDQMAELFDNKVCLDENSTDKLLMNFLADLQNEANEHTPVSGTQPNNSSDDISNFLEKKKEERDEVVFSDEDSDAIDTLVDNSDQGRVKVLVKPDELDNIPNTKTVKQIIIKDHNDIQIDSEGVRVSTRQETSDDSHNATEVPVEAMLFPGEAEKREASTGTIHESLLDFKANYRETGMENKKGISTENQDECDNSVEPFVLDENFDYDNVTLTPKYSPEDIHRLQSLITKMATVQ